MRILRKLCKNEQGAAAVEFAFAMPLFISLFFLIAQCGLLFLAEAGIRHAVDRAARAATVYVNATPISDAQIRTAVTNSIYGVDKTTLAPATIVRGISNGETYADITVSYNAPINLIVYSTPAITLSETRRAYLP
jgi:Flp pilus assembly protein TadG